MKPKQTGFTLIEILVVVTIIGVLAGLVVVLIPKGTAEAQSRPATARAVKLVAKIGLRIAAKATLRWARGEPRADRSAAEARLASRNRQNRPGPATSARSGTVGTRKRV